MLNFDETHFVFDHDDSRALGLQNEVDVNYSEISNGNEGTTIALLILGGSEAKIESAIAILTSNNNSNPIRGISDDVVSVSYR